MKDNYWTMPLLIGLLAWLNIKGHLPVPTITNGHAFPPQRQPDKVMAKAQDPSPRIATLNDGNYQFCSKPDPGDWRGGDGVCFVFSKRGTAVDGYYGYPHSNNFVCIRGQARDQQIHGEGLIPFWQDEAGANPVDPDNVEDQAGRLHLSQGKRMSSPNRSKEGLQILFFASASLNLNQFYQYPSPRMAPVSNLCDWQGL